MAVQGPVINWVADHRKHHAHTDEEGDPTFPRSARHGLSKAESSLDPSAWLIAAMEKVGLARDVVRITPERQREKLASGA
jgi:fatty-acid desaturase